MGMAGVRGAYEMEALDWTYSEVRAFEGGGAGLCSMQHARWWMVGCGRSRGQFK